MPNVFDQFDPPTAAVTPDGKNPFDAFDANPFDQFDEPGPEKYTSPPGGLKLNPLQQVQMQSLSTEVGKGIDPENAGATLSNLLRGNDDVFLQSVAPPIAAAVHTLSDNPITRGAGYGLNFAGQAMKGDVEAALFRVLGQPELANQELVATAGNMNPALKEKNESLGIDTSDPYEEARQSLPMAERMASGVGPGLLESAPQMALAAVQPEIGAASFGLTPDGFDPAQAAAMIIAPEAGKMIGGIAEKLAAKAGISNEQALGVINRLGGGTGVAGLISSPAAYQIAQMKPGQERDTAIQDAASNGILAGVLGSMAGHGEGLTPKGIEKPLSQKVDDLASVLKTLEATIRGNQLRSSTESSKTAQVETTANGMPSDENSQDAPGSPALVTTEISQPRSDTTGNVPRSATTTSTSSDPHYVYSKDGEGGLDNQSTQAGVGNYLRRQGNVPEVQIVNDPNWTHNGYGVRGTVQDGKIIINRAFIDNADTLQNVLREEHNHSLLSSEEGQQAIRYAAKNNLGLPQLADLSAKYPIQPGESVADYRLRLTDEFISKAASEQLPIWKQVVERVKGWLADKGIGELSDEETARAIVRSLKAGKETVKPVLTPKGPARFGTPDSVANESTEENSNLAARYNLADEPVQGISREEAAGAINQLFGTRELPARIRVIWNRKASGDATVQGRRVVLNSAQISSPEEAPQAILREWLSDIWYQPEAQKAWQYVDSKLQLENLTAELDRRKANGLRTDTPIVREAVAIARLINSEGRDRVVGNFHNAIRGAIKQKFGVDLPAAANPQLNEAVIQFLRQRKLPESASPGQALIPQSAVSRGKWGESRLDQVLRGAGIKPSKMLTTSLGPRSPDRVLNRVIHEAKGGLNVKLEGKIRKQILKDSELLRKGKVKGVHWHFFQGAQPETLRFLEQNGIGYTVY